MQRIESADIATLNLPESHQFATLHGERVHVDYTFGQDAQVTLIHPDYDAMTIIVRISHPVLYRKG